MVYQPIVDLNGPRIAEGRGAGAGVYLARARCRRRSSSPWPKMTGMIVPLTRAVIEQVCSDIVHMGDALPPDFRVSASICRGSTSWTPS